jgi:hypothetical protein
MSVLTRPQGRIPIGYAMVGGQRVPVALDLEWDRYFAVLTERAGGVVGPTNIVQYIQTTVAPSVVLDNSGDESGDQIFILQNTTVSGGGGGASWTEVEIDFGTDPVYDAQFTITDAAITGTSKVQVLPCGQPATGRTSDDWQWDGATFAAMPGSGSATCYATFLPGPIVGPRKVQYSVGA